MQNKRWSIIETIINVLSGFAIAQLLILYMLPLWEIQVTIHDSLEISAVFTLISLFRGYVCRRIFNYFSNPVQHTRRYIRKHYKGESK